MELGDYLRVQMATRWEAGSADCCTFAGDWSRDAWGLGDPVAAWRGRYRSDAQAIRFISQAGGLANLWRQGLASIGVEPVENVQPGDVGLVPAETCGGLSEVGAIWTGQRWAFRAPVGVILAPVQHIIAWGPRG